MRFEEEGVYQSAIVDGCSESGRPLDILLGTSPRLKSSLLPVVAERRTTRLAIAMHAEQLASDYGSIAAVDIIVLLSKVLSASRDLALAKQQDRAKYDHGLAQPHNERSCACSDHL
jgi:hypothetical protein